MSTENELKELMELVDRHGNACENFGDYQTIKNADVCIKIRRGIEARLSALLTELEAAREDAEKNKKDADCFRWWVNETSVKPGLVSKHYRKEICGEMEAKNSAIDAARKGEA